jgi:hypothetical protein
VTATCVHPAHQRNVPSTRRSTGLSTRWTQVHTGQHTEAHHGLPTRPEPRHRVGAGHRRAVRQTDVTGLGNLSKWAFPLCFAGVGLTFDIRDLARSGVRPLVVAALGLVVVAACSLGLVLLTSGLLA